MEVALPLASLGVEEADAELRRGFNLEWAGNGFDETITSNTATMPYTWCSFFMK
ncbi:MAG: hypothetical protein IJC16_08900 [Rikenellaceae bacterium]|nr:hypothetical protein [Rikenellaceae bacterium]